MKIAVHPLFWVFGIYFCLTSRLFVFLLITLAALEHECAHAFAAAKRGYALRKIVLMPYGAVVKGDIGGISLKDELAVACAGPLVSGVTALGFVALWWLFPDTYPYTDTAAFACASLALVNLIPACPLDGGRVLFCLLSLPFGRRNSGMVCSFLSVACAIGLIVLFLVMGWQGVWNVTLPVFSLFLLTGQLQGERFGYDRIRFDLSADLKRGVEEKRVAVTEEMPLAKVIPYLSRDHFLVLDVFTADGEGVGVLRQTELCRWLEKEELGESLGFLLKKAKKTSARD